MDRIIRKSWSCSSHSFEPIKSDHNDADTEFRGLFRIRNFKVASAHSTIATMNYRKISTDMKQHAPELLKMDWEMDEMTEALGVSSHSVNLISLIIGLTTTRGMVELIHPLSFVEDPNCLML
jgi:hypothetical protein